MRTEQEATPTGDGWRFFGVFFLLALAIIIAFQGAYWGLALVAVEVLSRPIGYFLDSASIRIDAFRLYLAPAKRIPGALIGLPLLGLGLALGVLAPESVQWLGDGVNTVVRGIARAAPYVIFFTLTPSIAGTLAVGRAGKFALWVNGAYAILTIAAGILAILVLVPVFGLRIFGSGATETSGVAVDWGQLVFGTPAFVAILMAAGLALMIHGLRLRGLYGFTQFVGGKIVDLLGDLLKILLPIILFSLGVFIPTKVGEAVDKAREAGDTTGAGWVGNLEPGAAYFVAVGALVLILGIWITGLAVGVMRYTKFPLPKFFRDYFLDVYSYAWATASSNATIPLNLERTGNALHVRREVREFILPLGATVHLDGTMIGAMTVSVIGAQLVGYTPTVFDLVLILLPLMIVTVGAPGIPGGLAVVGGPVVANLLPLPLGTEAAFTAIFIGFNLGLSDQFRTGVNATGNGILCRLFEYWYPTKFVRPDARPSRRPKKLGATA